MVENIECWENLANAIITVAAKDYKRELLRQKVKPKSKVAKRNINKLEMFFYSHWFEILTNLDPRYLLERVKENVEEEYNAYQLELSGQEKGSDRSSGSI